MQYTTTVVQNEEQKLCLTGDENSTINLLAGLPSIADELQGDFVLEIKDEAGKNYKIKDGELVLSEDSIAVLRHVKKNTEFEKEAFLFLLGFVDLSLPDEAAIEEIKRRVLIVSRGISSATKTQNNFESIVFDFLSSMFGK